MPRNKFMPISIGRSVVRILPSFHPDEVYYHTIGYHIAMTPTPPVPPTISSAICTRVTSLGGMDVGCPICEAHDLVLGQQGVQIARFYAPRIQYRVNVLNMASKLTEVKILMLSPQLFEQINYIIERRDSRVVLDPYKGVNFWIDKVRSDRIMRPSYTAGITPKYNLDLAGYDIESAKDQVLNYSSPIVKSDEAQVINVLALTHAKAERERGRLFGRTRPRVEHVEIANFEERFLAGRRKINYE